VSADVIEIGEQVAQEVAVVGENAEFFWVEGDKFHLRGFKCQMQVEG
jgi:hypothetical protein